MINVLKINCGLLPVHRLSFGYLFLNLSGGCMVALLRAIWCRLGMGVGTGGGGAIAPPPPPNILPTKKIKILKIVRYR